MSKLKLFTETVSLLFDDLIKEGKINFIAPDLKDFNDLATSIKRLSEHLTTHVVIQDAIEEKQNQLKTQ